MFYPLMATMSPYAGALATGMARLAPWAVAGAGALGAYGMIHWADTNVEQTKMISEDNRIDRIMAQERLDFEREKWETTLENREEDYDRSLLQTGMIESFDQKARQFQASQQNTQMQFEANMYNAKQAQIAQDRQTYMINQAIQQSGISTTNPSNDRIALAFVLTELSNSINDNKPKVETEDEYFDELDYFNQEDEEEEEYYNE